MPKIDIPVYCMAGWRDYYAGSAFESYKMLTELGISPDVRVRIGDHGHSGAPDFTETIRWLDYHLKGIDTGIEDEPPINIQVRHGRWRMEDRWPLKGTKFTDCDNIQKGPPHPDPRIEQQLATVGPQSEHGRSDRNGCRDGRGAADDPPRCRAPFPHHTARHSRVNRRVWWQ